MSWSYTPSEYPSLKDAVRFELPDTEEAAPLFQDEEIEYALSQEGEEVLAAAAHCCEQLARKFSLQADVQAGSASTTYSKAAKGLSERAEALRKRASGLHAPFAGGLSRAEKRALRTNRDREDGPFRLGQFQGASRYYDREG